MELYEFVNLKKGDKVRIVSEWNEDSNESSTGFMDKWLNKVMTFDHFRGDNAIMKEDDGKWLWNRHTIDIYYYLSLCIYKRI